jgi:hypothetical protein
MTSGHADGSEKDVDYSSSSFRSLSTPTRIAREKIRKVKKIAAENQIQANSTRGEEIRLRIQAKIEEQKSARLKQQKKEDKPRDAPSMMAALSKDIEAMELEAQKLLEELESAHRETKRKHLAKDGVHQEFLAGRITELEVENKILMTRLQSGQATVDSIRLDIANTATSNQDCKRILREEKAASRPLQLEHEYLRSKLEQADNDLQALEAKANNNRTAKKVETDQRAIFEQATRDILELQRNHRLKKQVSQRKLQQRQQKNEQQMQQHIYEHLQQETPKNPLQRTIKRQTSWWQLDTPEKAPKQAVRAQSFHIARDGISRSVSEDSSIDTSGLDTSSASSEST